VRKNLAATHDYDILGLLVQTSLRTLLWFACRELPSADTEVWYEASDAAYRWRQTASTVLLQLHALPDHIMTSKQLRVTIEPLVLRVEELQAHGQPELLLEAQLARAVVPQDSTWVFVRAAAGRPAAGRSGNSGSSGSSAAVGSAALVPAAGGVVSALIGGQGCHVLLELTKMNLELYERYGY
jgi:hypothetical protein